MVTATDFPSLQEVTRTRLGVTLSRRQLDAFAWYAAELAAWNNKIPIQICNPPEISPTTLRTCETPPKIESTPRNFIHPAPSASDWLMPRTTFCSVFCSENIVSAFLRQVYPARSVHVSRLCNALPRFQRKFAPNLHVE